MERPVEARRGPSRTDASTAGAGRESGPAGAREPAPLAARIAEAAARLGFPAVGFAQAEEHPHAARLRAWLESGRHGTMRWMERDPARRSDPTRVLPAARSVISVVCPYYPGEWPDREDHAPPRGRIARYAWGRDYHRVLRRRLVRLAAVLREEAPGARWLAAVDTAPVLDRGWAERAGLGWIGKNTNLIRKGAGSWFFLGEIVTDLELPADAPARSYCGTCARCIAACPTGAILGPYRLDARRCISYLTIEHAGPIPLELRPAIGDRVFGCDDCQEVCPWNRFAVRTGDPALRERSGQQAPELIPLLALDEAAFRARFAGSAIRRAGRDRFVRNVAVALGNAGDERAVGALRRALLEDHDPFVRGHAAWALGRIGSAGARTALREAAERETEPEPRKEIDLALGTLCFDSTQPKPMGRKP